MKRFINSSLDYQVCIDVSFKESLSVAASTISHPSHLRDRSKELSDEDLLHYSDTIDTLINGIGELGFEILPSSHQSTESYTYYAISKLKDYPESYKFTMIFRLADHKDSNHSENSDLKNNTIIRTIQVMSNSMVDEVKAQKEIRAYAEDFISMVQSLI